MAFRDRTFTKPGVGEIRLRTGVFSKKVTEATFTPEQRETAYRVPVEAVESLMAADTLEQAMAVVRASESPSQSPQD